MGALNRDTLELIQSTAQQAKGITIQPLPNNPERTLVIGNGTHQVLDTPRVAPPRRHVVETVAGFVEAFDRWSGDCEEMDPESGLIAATASENPDEEKVPIRRPNIWLNLDGPWLLFFVDEPIRRSWVKLLLKFSPQWLTVLQFAKERTLQHKALVRLLRHDLHGAIAADLVTVFRTIDFKKMQAVRAAFEHQNQSLDQDLQASVNANGLPLPEEISVTVPLFAMREFAAFSVRLTITIDIDAAGGTFLLATRPGDVENALDEGREQISALLINLLAEHGLADIPILCGTPGKKVDGDE
jgi:hypothetical protein